MKKYCFLLTAIVSLLASSAHAGSSDASTKATATMVSTCSVSATNVNFGTLNVTVINNASGSLSILCSKNLPYTVQMIYPHNGQGNDAGIYFSGIMQGSLPGNNDWVNYNIFLPNGNTIWGNGTDSINGANVGYLSATGTGSNQTYPVSIQAGTALSTGSDRQATTFTYITPDTYSDTVTTLITY